MNALTVSDIFWMYNQLMKQDVDVIDFFLDDDRFFVKLSRPLDAEEARSFRGCDDEGSGLVLVISAIALKEDRNVVSELRPNETLQVEVSPDEGGEAIERLLAIARRRIAVVNVQRAARERTTDEEARACAAEQEARDREAERAARLKELRADREAAVERLRARLK